MRDSILKLFFCVVFASLFIAQPVLASDYPDRPINLTTMVGPGAQIDLLTRKLADKLRTELGQPVLVSNNPGGSHGSVMATDLKRANPNGYTLGVSATAAFTYTPHFASVRYSVDDFDYISKLGLNQSGLVCAPNRPWKTLKDAFEWAKKENTGLTYMFQGADDREVMGRIAAQEGVNLSLMPSTGGPSIIQAVMGGHADIGHLGAILFEYVQADRLTLLAATTPERLTAIQDVPTLREQGWDETVEMFVVLAGPKGLPADVLERLDQAMTKLGEDAEFQKFITVDLKMAPVPFGREYAEQYMQEASERFARQAAQGN